MVYIEGPNETEYEGGIFQAKMTFPEDYPYSPPKIQFTSDFWHPNVYKDGKVCISILHPPGFDPMNQQERPEERWSPAQSPETILLSIISLLSDPNLSSPANIDASVELKNSKNKYKERIKKTVEKSLKELPKDYIMPYKLTKKKQVVFTMDSPCLVSPFEEIDENNFYFEEDDYIQEDIKEELE